MSEQFALSLQFFAADARIIQSTEADELRQAINVSIEQVRLAPRPNQLNEDS